MPRCPRRLSGQLRLLPKLACRRERPPRRAGFHPGADRPVRFDPGSRIGLLRMTDHGKQDDKVLAVPTSRVDPLYDAVRVAALRPFVSTAWSGVEGSAATDRAQQAAYEKPSHLASMCDKRSHRFVTRLRIFSSTLRA